MNSCRHRQSIYPEDNLDIRYQKTHRPCHLCGRSCLVVLIMFINISLHQNCHQLLLRSVKSLLNNLSSSFHSPKKYHRPIYKLLGHSLHPTMYHRCRGVQSCWTQNHSPLCCGCLPKIHPAKNTHSYEKNLNIAHFTPTMRNVPLKKCATRKNEKCSKKLFTCKPQCSHNEIHRCS